MPYLRFSRDKRGYEHTYVLHGFRSGSRPQLLYWFRTPPNITVGRLPLDEEGIRAIEAFNPELTFDWTRMTATPRPKPSGEGEQAAASSGRTGSRRARAAAPQPVVPSDGPEPVDAEPADAEAVDAALADAESLEAEAPATEDPEADDREDDAADPERRHPVAALLGDDALVRMRARYAELRARLADSHVDGDARASLAARIEDLNPDGWRAGEDVVLGIERFDAEAAAIRAALGRRRHSAPS